MNENGVCTIPASSVLTWGILSLVFCCTPVWGLICAIIARKKAKTFALENGGECIGKAKVGNILSIVGLVLAIIMTVFWAIYLFVVVGLVATYNY